MVMCIEEEIRKVRHATVLPRSAGTEFSCLAFAATCAMHFSNMSYRELFKHAILFCITTNCSYPIFIA